jgi:hypothetical protein
MIELSIPREAVGLLGAHIEAYFAIPVLRSGLALYNEKKVTHIWKDQFNIIHAIVGSTGSDFKLQIDLDFFLASECQCTERFCLHMAAVFFTLYAQHEQPLQWISDVESLQSPANPEPVAPAASIEHNFNPLGLNEKIDDRLVPPEWHILLDKELNALYRRQTDRFRIDIFYFTAYKKLAARAEMIMEAEKPYFRAFCAIRIMLHAERHMTQHADEYPLPYYQRLTVDLNDHFMDRLRDAIGGITPSSAHHDPLEQECAEAIRILMINHLPLGAPVSLQWEDVHRFVWEQLLNRTDWLQDEERRLTELEAVDPWTSAEHAGSLALMSAHISWLLGSDHEAMRKLSLPYLSAGKRIVSYIETHYRTQSWSRLGQWLTFSLSRLRRAPADSFNRALSIWRDYASQTGDFETYWNALSQLLPRSYLQYTEHLIQSEQVEKWVAFHLLNGITPAKIDRTQLKQLEHRQPSLLLPVYHQAIARTLGTKNRAAYKEAVKLLKRLKELYKEASASHQFQIFIRELTARNQRLHAFIEELEKGKLLE